MNKLLAGLGLGYLAIVIACLAAWVTHVVICIKTASWLFLIAGALLAPIGVVHGIGVWFGIF